MNLKDGNSQNTVIDSNKVCINTKLDRGRWKPEEHELFLKGLELHGRDWKKIEALVGTRTGPQIRSHAQKYFNRINKEKEDSNETSDMLKINTTAFSVRSLGSEGNKSEPLTRKNLRKQKEEEKHIEMRKERTVNSNMNTESTTPDSFGKLFLNYPQMTKSAPSSPKLAENQGFKPGNMNKIGSIKSVQPPERMYTEDEVLTLIRHIVKEFANIMGKYSLAQMPGLTSNLGMSNLNTILLLSLMTREQTNLNFTSSLLNLTNPATGFEMPHTSFQNQNFDVSSLLKNQGMKEEPQISSENLMQIPKLSSCIGFTPPNLSLPQEVVGFVQSDNSYIPSTKLKMEGEEKPSDLSLVKSYDQFVGETKDESVYSTPTMEVKDTQ